MKYFENKWTSSESLFLHATKLKVKKLWDNIYKWETIVIQPQLSPLVNPPINYLAGLLNRVAP